MQKTFGMSFLDKFYLWNKLYRKRERANQADGKFPTANRKIGKKHYLNIHLFCVAWNLKTSFHVKSGIFIFSSTVYLVKCYD